MDDLVIDSVQFVCPLVLVHSVFAPASDPNGFFQPACGFVRFLIYNSGGVPIDDMIVDHDMLSYKRKEKKKKKQKNKVPKISPDHKGKHHLLRLSN